MEIYRCQKILVKMYEEWRKANNVKDTPCNVLAFLLNKKLINIEKATVLADRYVSVLRPIEYSPYYERNEYYEDHYAVNPAYEEIIKLHSMLADSLIPHVIRRSFDGWQVCYPFFGDGRVISVIEHQGSYGRHNDLLEIMGLLTPEEETHDSVAGHLTADDVFGRIKKHWEENKEEMWRIHHAKWMNNLYKKEGNHDD